MAIDLSKFNDIRDDSRRVKGGDIFVAISGDNSNGHDFIAKAIKNGATAVVHEKSWTPMNADNVEFFASDDCRLALAQLSAEKYQPLPNTLVGITGTSGKSSVVEFLRQFWQVDKLSAAALGTLGVRCGALKITEEKTHGGNALTSMPTVALHRMLQKLSQCSVTHAALEASSHGLMQKRLHGLHFSAAGFTNLSRDHLDYHKNMEEYFQAKMILFEELLKANAPIVAYHDSEYFAPLKKIAESHKHKIYSYGSDGDIRLLNLKESPQGMNMKVDFFGTIYETSVPLIGAFQAHNLLMAGSIAHLLGTSADTIFSQLPSMAGIDGRMQMIPCDFGTVIVDYAHKPEALRQALTTLRPYAKGDLIAVFGCGGDRDKGKRAQMGSISAELADWTIITDDNPRSEAPEAIRKAIVGGMGDADYAEVGDRKSAIFAGLEHLRKVKNSVLLIAGKGHESGQIIGNKTVPFDDAETAKILIGG